MIKTNIDIGKNNKMDCEQDILYIKGSEYESKRVLKRGDILGIDFGINVGREKSGIRPAVVVSDVSINEISENIIVAPLTSYRNKLMPGEELANILPSQFILSNKFYKQLKRTSVVQVEDIRSVSKKRITRFLGDLSDKSLEELNQCVKNTLTF